MQSGRLWPSSNISLLLLKTGRMSCGLIIFLNYSAPKNSKIRVRLRNSRSEKLRGARQLVDEDPQLAMRRMGTSLLAE